MGIYYGQTNDFERRKKEHQEHIRQKENLSPTFLAAARKYHWTDFQIEEVERFNFRIDAKLKEKKLIIMSHRNPNHKLYNEKIPVPNANQLTMTIIDDLADRFLDFAEENEINKSELSRIILRSYLNKDKKTIVWSNQKLKPFKKTQISVNLTNELLKEFEYFSELNKIDKKVIYHSAVKLFFDEN